MRKVIAFQEYTPQITQGIGWRVPLFRVLLLASLVAVPVAVFALSIALRVLPLHGLVVVTSLAAYLPLAFYRKPSVKIDEQFKVTFQNRPMVNRDLLRASLLSVGIFTVQAFLWAMALGDKL